MKRWEVLYIGILVGIVIGAFAIIITQPIPESCKNEAGYVSEC